MNPASTFPMPEPDIYEGILKLGLKLDLHGWNSEHPVFECLIRETRPEVIVEVGSWKGASAINMARIRAMLLPTRTWRIYCVDTWLGSREIWRNAHLRETNPRRHGYPQVYFQFLHNVYVSGFSSRIVPLPMASRHGAEVLRENGIAAELIYIDASHDYVDVRDDLVHYWPLLAPGGVMFGDDYHAFSGVRTAVEEFALIRHLKVELFDGNFWVMRKAT